MRKIFGMTLIVILASIVVSCLDPANADPDMLVVSRTILWIVGIGCVAILLLRHLGGWILHKLSGPAPETDRW